MGDNWVLKFQNYPLKLVLQKIVITWVNVDELIKLCEKNRSKT